MTAAVAHIDHEDTKVLDVTPLFALFDATLAVPGAWLTVFEKYMPGAEYAARLFASARGLTIEVNTRCGDETPPFQVVYVRKGTEAIITVHRAEVES